MPESPPSTSTGSVNHEVFRPIAGVLAVIFPGAGHVYLKQTWRGVGVGVGVLGLFFGGILIGGIDVVDRQEDTIWFIGQALVGPIAFATDRYHQSRFKAYAPTRAANGTTVAGEFRTGNPGERRNVDRPIPVWESAPGARPPNTKSLAHPNEIGTLFATIAGMLNLIAILDALFHRESRAEVDPNAPADSPEPDLEPDLKPDPKPEPKAASIAAPAKEGA